MNLPFVSVLVAARNEQDNISHCLDALAASRYPTGLFEVWVANDDSSDSTREIVLSYTQKYPNFYLFDVNTQLGMARGKANALAHLAHLAKGEVFLITDADVVVNPDWLKSMALRLKDGFAVVTGFTFAEGRGLLSVFQTLDWVYALSLIKLFTDWGRPVTCAGNNMGITREAYFSTGGYEQIPFSVTEDYALFRQILKQNYPVTNEDKAGFFAKTKTIVGLRNLLNQRKRWMTGAMVVPWHTKWMLVLQTLFLPILLILALFSYRLALAIGLSKFVLQSLYLSVRLWMLGKKKLIWYLFPYEIYVLTVNLILHVDRLMDSKVVWKGREFE
jgi:cellulose synthase/poly-beta-1,6-N-acetylglucosamine synthase-like glycosyltransferase